MLKGFARSRVYSWLRLLHRWLGLVVGMLLLVACLSATYLAADDMVGRLTKPDASAAKPVFLLNKQKKAQATQAIFDVYPTTRAITFPTENTPFFEVFRQGGYVFLDAQYQIIQAPSEWSRDIRRFFLLLHRNFHLSEIGSTISGSAALSAVLLALVGLILTLPLLRTLRWRQAIPKNAKRGNLIRAHMFLGLLVIAPLLIASLTGAGLTWRSQAGQVLQITKAEPQKIAPTKFADMQEATLFAQNTWPNDTLLNVFKRESRGGRGQDRFTYRFETQDANWLTGFDTLNIAYPKARALTAKRFIEQPLNQQLYDMIRALHDGTRMPFIYAVWLLLVMIFSSIMLSFTTWSLLSHLVSKTRPRAVSSNIYSKPISK